MATSILRDMDMESCPTCGRRNLVSSGQCLCHLGATVGELKLKAVTTNTKVVVALRGRYFTNEEYITERLVCHVFTSMADAQAWGNQYLESDDTVPIEDGWRLLKGIMWVRNGKKEKITTNERIQVQLIELDVMKMQEYTRNVKA